jgi:hypothetical protein
LKLAKKIRGREEQERNRKDMDMWRQAQDHKMTGTDGGQMEGQNRRREVENKLT